MEKRKIWLSLDWDFFCREKPEWDWGHTETRIHQVLSWAVRASTSLARGEDLRKETSLKYAKPAPGRFWQSLQRLGFTFDRTSKLGIADSHRHAYRFFTGEPDDVQIVHVDAHHDLFYSVDALDTSIEQDDPRCDDWHLLTLLRGNIRSLVVYPPWKGLCEWEWLMDNILNTANTWEIHRTLRKMADACVWGDPNVPAVAGPVEAVFVCRSSAWTPPWHDKAFNRLVREAEVLTGTKAEVVGPDPRMRRQLDWRRIERFAHKIRQELG